MARAALPAIPLINREASSVEMFFATAAGTWKTVKRNNAMYIGSIRPYASERGPQRSDPMFKIRLRLDSFVTLWRTYRLQGQAHRG